jgi:hypothetical protein
MRDMVYDLSSRARPAQSEQSRPSLTPAERALLTAAGPTYIEAAEFGVPDSPLASAVEPDDWRLYYLMRELSAADRGRILEFTQLLFNLRHAQRFAAGETMAHPQE